MKFTLQKGSVVRDIEMLDEKINPANKHFEWNGKFFELTTDTSLTNGSPTLNFRENSTGSTYYPREKFSPIPPGTLITQGTLIPGYYKYILGTYCGFFKVVPSSGVGFSGGEFSGAWSEFLKIYRYVVTLQGGVVHDRIFIGLLPTMVEYLGISKSDTLHLSINGEDFFDIGFGAINSDGRYVFYEYVNKLPSIWSTRYFPLNVIPEDHPTIKIVLSRTYS